MTIPALYPSTSLYPYSTLYPYAESTPATTSDRRGWTMHSRTHTYRLSITLPIISVQAVIRHMAVSKAVAKTPFTPDAWLSLQPGCGLLLYRAGVQKFSGLVTERQIEWDSANGRAVITVSCVGDEQVLADRPVFPDPLRAADDQTVNNYWTYTGPASSAMRRLISDQAGPTCRPDRQVAGLTLGADPGVGLSRTWTGLFSPFTLDQMALISVASGANLGLRVISDNGTLLFDIVAPTDRSGTVKFSADLSNLAGFTYREAAPTVTDALSAGQGDLHLRLRKHTVTSSPLALSWGRRIWSYIDRRDTADVAELTTANADALAEGDATVSLAVTLLDSQAATYGVDWDLGDKITVYVGLPGQVKVATVVDVVREISFDIDENGAEKIRPAIGSYDAKAVLPTPTQRQLTVVGQKLANFVARQ